MLLAAPAAMRLGAGERYELAGVNVSLLAWSTADIGPLAHDDREWGAQMIEMGSRSIQPTLRRSVLHAVSARAQSQTLERRARVQPHAVASGDASRGCCVRGRSQCRAISCSISFECGILVNIICYGFHASCEKKSRAVRHLARTSIWDLSGAHGNGGLGSSTRCDNARSTPTAPSGPSRRAVRVRPPDARDARVQL